MALYRVWVRLECEYDDIEADSEEEAFHIASDAAMGGGSWDYQVEEIEENVNHGHWIDCSNGWMCSVCERDNSYDEPYCPNCGAKMDGGLINE